MKRVSLLCFVALTALSACATVSQQQRETFRAQDRAIANKMADWATTAETFRRAADILSQQILLVSQSPGWPDILQILTQYGMSQYREGKALAQLDKQIALGVWGLKWNADGHHMSLLAESLLIDVGLLSVSYSSLQIAYGDIAMKRDWLHIQRALLGEGTEEGRRRLFSLYQEQDQRTRADLARVMKKFCPAARDPHSHRQTPAPGFTTIGCMPPIAALAPPAVLCYLRPSWLRLLPSGNRTSPTRRP
jgi:hypothetical protein